MTIMNMSADVLLPPAPSNDTGNSEGYVVINPSLESTVRGFAGLCWLEDRGTIPVSGT